MKVRGILSLKNEVVRAWRLERGLSQFEAADLAGIPRQQWSPLECMRFDLLSPLNIELVARLMKVPVEVIAPEALAGKRVQNRVEMVAEISDARLASGQTHGSLTHALPAPDEAAMLEEAKVRLREAMGDLTYREREVLNCRFGLDGEPPLTLEECGKIFRVSRDRVRQIECKAVRRLQSDPLRKRIEEALP